MSLHFFSRYGGKRADKGPPLPEMLGLVPTDAEDDAEDTHWDADPSEVAPASTEGDVDEVDLDRERPRAEWVPIKPEPGSAFHPGSWLHRPLRFVDGKDVGEVVAWLRSSAGHLLPVRLSQIGAVVLREVSGMLRRETLTLVRAVTLPGDLFPWHEVEALSRALQEAGMHLLLCRNPKVSKESELYEIAPWRKAVQQRSNAEMAALEEHLSGLHREIPTLVDGRLEPRSGGRGLHSKAIGVIKTQRQRYLHTRGLQVLHDLAPQERTPLFVIHKGLPVVSFYLRLWGKSPGYGILRVEIPRGFYEHMEVLDPHYADRLALFLCAHRTRRGDYGRAPVTLDPVVRAEESLSSLILPLLSLQSQFYRLTQM